MERQFKNELCAKAPTAEAAKAELDKVIKGFCKGSKDCRAVGEASVEKDAGILEKIFSFLAKFSPQYGNSGHVTR